MSMTRPHALGRELVMLASVVQHVHSHLFEMPPLHQDVLGTHLLESFRCLLHVGYVGDRFAGQYFSFRDFRGKEISLGK
jgi:hypothetical protein